MKQFILLFMILAVSNFSLISQPTGQSTCRAATCRCSPNHCRTYDECMASWSRNPEQCNRFKPSD